MQTCMFTGHRLQNLPFGFNETDQRCIQLYKKLEKLIREKITEHGVENFMTGMALGIDCYAAEIVLKLKNKYPHVTLTAVLPCADQTAKWQEKNILRYNAILKECSEVFILQQRYTKDCMNKRNIYMTEHADSVIAVWDGSKSGTGNTVRFALKRGLPVTILDPITLKVRTY